MVLPLHDHCGQECTGAVTPSNVRHIAVLGKWNASEVSLIAEAQNE
jgi:hypothetical protein